MPVEYIGPAANETWTAFAQLAKYDETTGYFEAIAASEALDRSGEIFDFERSKPHFQKWSDGFKEATGGRSLGNVREMHGNVAAGKLTLFEPNDKTRQIKVGGFAVDPVSKTKLAQGVLTGVSIGGRYGEKWDDPVAKGAKRYEAIPYEISLVDFPCNPDAGFTVVKAGGSEEMRKFAVSLDDAEALQKWVESLPDEQRASLAKIAERKDVNSREGEHKYGDVKFADEKNKKYPIDTAAHIRAAWNYINKPKNAAKYDSADLRSIKSKIVAAWKDKIDKAGPPSARKDAPAAKAAYFDCVASMLAEKATGETIAKAAGELIGKPLEKGLYTVSQLAELLERLDCIACGTKFEEEIEGDGSVIPDELRDAVTNLSGILVHMVAEEVEEMNAGSDVEVMELAADGDLSKSIEDETKMNEELQKAHDAAKAELVTANESLAKVTGERDELVKGLAARDEALAKAAERIEALNEVVEKLKAEPAPIKAAMRVVSKGQDVGTPDAKEIEPVLKSDGTVDEVRTALKKALSEPVMVR